MFQHPDIFLELLCALSCTLSPLHLLFHVFTLRFIHCPLRMVRDHIDDKLRRHFVGRPQPPLLADGSVLQESIPTLWYVAEYHSPFGNCLTLLCGSF